MTVTPWGRADELRSRKLRPGPGATRDEVRANQRERLFGAMVAAVAEHGYEKTRVADLLELSGISRNTFYRHFENKQACFLATVDAIVEVGGKALVDAIGGKAESGEANASWNSRLAAGLDHLVGLIVEHPAAARLYYVETYAAGPEAIAKVERMGDLLEELARQALDGSPEHAGMPRDLLRAILKGVRRIIQTRLRTGRERDLLTEGPQLLRWALTYRTPPVTLKRPRKPPPLRFDVPSSVRGDPRERILDAVIELMSEKGYGALTITDIAQSAAISLTTFYAEFDSKEEAVVAAMRRGANRVLEVVAPVYREAADWPHAVAAGLRAFFAYLVIEQPFAKFGGLDVQSGSPLIVDVRDQLVAGGHAFLGEGYRRYPGVEPIAGEAIGATIDALIFDHLLSDERARLYELAPAAAYVTLAPFVGAEQACAIANSSR